MWLLWKKRPASCHSWIKSNLAHFTALEMWDNLWDKSISAKLWTAAVVVFECGGGSYHHNGEVLLAGFEISSVAKASHTRQSKPSSRTLVKTQTWKKTRGSCVSLFPFLKKVGLMQYWCYRLKLCFTQEHWILLVNNRGHLSWIMFLFSLNKNGK